MRSAGGEMPWSGTHESVEGSKGMAVEHTAEASIYSWAMLPKTPLLVLLFGALALAPLVLGVLAGTAVVLMLLEGEWMTAIMAGMACPVLLRIGWFFLPFLFGTCRLALSRRGLWYEEFVLGVRHRRACRELAAGEVAGLRIGDSERGGIEVRDQRGLSFFLRVPVGTGAFSISEVGQLKARWLADLGLPDG
ncbi:MAG: hypothetical protein ACT4QD_12455 [Acidobacteriota bacterium]